MKTLLWSALVAVVLIEILATFFRLQVWRKLADGLERAAFTFAEARDDHEQQKILLSAAWNLVGLMVYLWVILAVVLYGVTALPHQLYIDEEAFIWATSAAAMAYVWLRAQWVESRQRQLATQSSAAAANLANPSPSATVAQPSSGGYPRIARWLHWMALEIAPVRRISLDLEKNFYLRKAVGHPLIIDQPVYVMGMARSGTTIVLNLLEKTGAFHSPTYRDMPFILCPNLWRRLARYSRLDQQLAVRAHGDGLAIGFDSPESFEEVFWKTACVPLPGSALPYAAPDDEAMADFAAYRALSVHSALVPGQGTPKRYLSKNNNNVLRLQQLSAQPGAQLILLIRNPVATAWSSYQLHVRFSQMQTQDPFTQAYMRWLGHQEFGNGHRPLAMGTQHLPALRPDQPDYWLAYWLGLHQSLWLTYQALPPTSQARISWLHHDSFCEAPQAQLERLFQRLQINHPAQALASLVKPAAPTEPLQQHFSASWVDRSHALHRQILLAENL